MPSSSSSQSGPSSPAGPKAPLNLIQEMNRVLQMEGRAILQCSERIQANPEGFTKAISLMQSSLEKGGKIVVTGIGKSGKIGQKIAATLASTGSFSVFLHPTEGLHGDLGIVTPNDCILALSYTGNTEELLRLLPALKTLRVSIIGLGGKAKSQLATSCDAWIDAAVDVEACPHNLAPTTSTTLALALGDAIAVTLMQLRGFDEKSFAQNHPGGSIGKKLNLTVEQIMHQGDDVGTVTAQASMDEVVVLSGQKKLGAVLVVENTGAGAGKKLLGIITDGDIRRALQHREKFFTMLASQVMTAEPTTASPEMKALSALELMENRPSQISVLPVVDADGNWVGVLRLHDLVKSF